jgi:hypothetical protein
MYRIVPSSRKKHIVNSVLVITALIFAVIGVAILAEGRFKGWANLPGAILLMLGGFALIAQIPNSGSALSVKRVLLVIMLLITAGAFTMVGNKLLTIVSIGVIIIVFVAGYALLPPEAQSAAQTTASDGWSGFVGTFKNLMGAL